MRQERLERLAKALGMGVLEDVRLEQWDGRWWMVGRHASGDRASRALPRSGGVSTEREAITAAEAWLAPELDLLAGDEK